MELLLLLLLLALLLVPPVLVTWLLHKFWRLSKASAAQPDQGRWGTLVLLAALLCLVAVEWQLFTLELMSSGKNSNKLYADTFYQFLGPELLLRAVFAAVLMARFMRWRVAGSFLGGLLLALVAAVGIWRYQHRPQPTAEWMPPPVPHEPTPAGWQDAVLASFERRRQAGTVLEASAVAQPPEYPGGEIALQQVIWVQLRRPTRVVNHLTGTVTVEFIVEPDGSVALPHVTNGLGGAYDAEAVRVVQHLPQFEPGFRQGRPVAVVWACGVPFQ